jgi:hypothetical protein
MAEAVGLVSNAVPCYKGSQGGSGTLWRSKARPGPQGWRHRNILPLLVEPGHSSEGRDRSPAFALSCQWGCGPSYVVLE